MGFIDLKNKTIILTSSIEEIKLRIIFEIENIPMTNEALNFIKKKAITMLEDLKKEINGQ